MKAVRHESSGVHLGWSISTGDGFILRHGNGRIVWSWAYVTINGRTITSPRLALEEGAAK